MEDNNKWSWLTDTSAPWITVKNIFDWTYKVNILLVIHCSFLKK